MVRLSPVRYWSFIGPNVLGGLGVSGLRGPIDRQLQVFICVIRNEPRRDKGEARQQPRERSSVTHTLRQLTGYTATDTGSTMGLHVASRLFLALLLLAAATPVSWAQQHVPAAPQESQEAEFPIEGVVQSLREVLDQHKTIPFPGLPTITIPGDQVSLTISLADVYLDGLNDVVITPKLSLGTANVHFDFNKISFLVGSYTSSGHILNLPFNGEGPMYIRLHHLLVDFSIDYKLSIHPCVKANTTDYDLDLIRMEAHLENLNKGTDLGQLVDIVVPSFGQDIVEKLQVLIKTKYYDFFDSTLVGLINAYLQCSSKTVEEVLTNVEFMKVMGDIVKDFLP